MPRQTFAIERFNMGLVTALDVRDINPDACADGSKDLEASSAEGTLYGRKADLNAARSNITAATILAAMIRKVDGGQCLVNATASACYANDNGDDTRTLTLSISNPSSITVFNREARVGADTPQFVGYTGDPATTLVSGDCELSRHTGATTQNPIMSTAGLNQGNLDRSKVYYYKISLTYDDYQESPLNATQTDNILGAPIVWCYSAFPGITVQFRVDDTFWNNGRFTAANLYRAESLGPSLASAPGTQYRLVGTYAKDASGWSTASGYHHRTVDDRGDIGQTYETRTGCPETLDTNFVKYKLGAMVNSDFVVAKCDSSLLDDATHMIFKSKSNRPDMFNWIEDYLRIPTIPNCITSYAGRLFAFDSSTMYRINTDGMYIEDALVGVGVSGANCALGTEHGLFILDKASPYVYDGSSVIPIGSPIIDKYRAESWTRPAVLFHQASGSVLFANLGGGQAYVWNIAKKRWDLWTFTAAGCGYTDLNGALWMTTG
jgi:hypothetical protein